MSLLNSLFSGVSGLRNHQSMMDVVGNNIANVNSIGYKGSRVTFSDTFNNFVRFGSNPTDTSGGTNAFQIGLGMKISSIDRNWNQGTFERTGITTDLALQGNGLFILENNGEKFYSRAGAFAFDANGKLVNPQNGSIVQGKLATEDGVIPPGNNLDDIVVDANLKLPAEATTLTSWGGNLNSMASLTRTEKYAQSGNINASMAVGDTITDQNTIYDFNGNAYTLQTSYEKTAADTYDLTYELVDEAGTSILGPTTAEAVFDADGNLATLDGAAASTISLEDSAIGINFQLDVSEVTQLDSAATLSSTVDDNREPTIVNGTVTVYDSLGNPHNLTITFTKTASNSWNWNTEVPASSGTLSSSSGSIVFNSDGSINTISPNPPVVSLTPSGGASVQNIKLNFGESFG
ncbi:MAG: flagellar hook-basal body complex protein, partial [Melioribacteraceae bacterium]|nr:flagellar hook-basal body complex protein [Melioribacteraceae bacterium]